MAIEDLERTVGEQGAQIAELESEVSRLQHLIESLESRVNYLELERS